MIGGEEDLPRILDEEQQLQPGRPLHRVDEVAGAVGVRDDTAAGFVLDVQVPPFPPSQFIEQVLPRSVGGDGDRIAKQDSSRVGGDARMGVEVFGKLSRFRADRIPAVAAVGVVLRMGDVGPVPFQVLERVHRGGDVSRRTEVVAVQVHWVRKAELVANPGELRHNHPGSQLAVSIDGRRELLGVVAIFPGRDAAGIDRLDAVGLGRPQIPRQDLLRALKLPLFELIEQDLVVRHERQRRLVDNRNVGQLFVRVPGGKDRNSRFVDRGPAHAGIEIARGKRGGGHSAQTAPPRLGANECLGAAMILRRHRASEIDRAAGHMRVNVHAAGEDNHSGGINRPAPFDGRNELPLVVDAEILDDAVDLVGWVVDFSARDAKHGVRLYLCVQNLGLAAVGEPERLFGNCLVDPADDFFIRGVRGL